MNGRLGIKAGCGVVLWEGQEGRMTEKKMKVGGAEEDEEGRERRIWEGSGMHEIR